MKGYIENIEQRSLENTTFRTVLYTGVHSQLVVMSLLPGEDIGEEVHEDTDQFIRVESGTGTAIIDGVSRAISDGSAIVVPAGATHNIKNDAGAPMKLYTVYAPPHHRDGVVHATKADAESDTEEFDGHTSE